MRNFSRGSINGSKCAKEGWEKIGIPSVLYGAEVVHLSKWGINQLEVEQLRMGRYILGASQNACREGIRGTLGWWGLEHRLNQVFLNFARRFEWTDRCWGKTIWERIREPNAYNKTWLDRVQVLSQKYDIEMDKDNMNRNTWKGYVKRQIGKYVKEEWLRMARTKVSLKYYAQSESDYGRCGPLDGAWNTKALVRMQIGDVKTANKRKHMNWADEGKCLCCEEGWEDSIEHVVGECPTFQEERAKIWGGEGEMGTVNERMRFLLGLDGEIDTEGWSNRTNWAGQLMAMRQRKWAERTRKESDCNNIVYVEIVQEGWEGLVVDNEVELE